MLPLAPLTPRLLPFRCPTSHPDIHAVHFQMKRSGRLVGDGRADQFREPDLGSTEFRPPDPSVAACPISLIVLWRREGRLLGSKYHSHDSSPGAFSLSHPLSLSLCCPHSINELVSMSAQEERVRALRALAQSPDIYDRLTRSLGLRRALLCLSPLPPCPFLPSLPPTPTCSLS